MQGLKASTLRPQCPLWVISGHFCGCGSDVRFTPESGHFGTSFAMRQKHTSARQSTAELLAFSSSLEIDLSQWRSALAGVRERTLHTS